MEETRKNQLDGTYNKRGGVENSWRGEITAEYNKRKTKKMDRTCTERRFITKETIIEGKMERKRTPGRPRQMMLDWLMKDGYRRLKEQWLRVMEARGCPGISQKT